MSERYFMEDVPDINDLLESAEMGYPEPAEKDTQLLIGATGDHEGHARCVMSLYPDRFLYCDSYGWMHYNGKHWQSSGAESEIERAVMETLKARRIAAVKSDKDGLLKVCKANSGNVLGTVRILQSLLTVSIEDFDKDPDLLNCGNCVIDLRTGAKIPHHPNQRFTYACPVDYDENADYSEWVKFLEGVTINADFLQIAVGYSLTGHTWEEVLFYLYGPTRSGKGTFTETLMRALGATLSTETDFSTFTAPRIGDTQNFDLAPLKPCRLIAASESDRNTPMNAAKIKAMTGGNHIRCAFKHHDHFTYRPQFKIWLSSNHPVNVDVEDDAAWGRLRVVDFPNSHLGAEDKTLKQRLTSPENLRGILRWAVIGASRWYAGYLPYPETIRSTTKGQREARDYIRLFLDEYLEPAPAGRISSADIYTLYAHWCEDNGVPKKYHTQFSQAIERAGYPPKRGSLIPGGKIVRYFEGLRQKS